MKWYKRYPDAAISGMAELNFEQIGFYNLLLDLLYARDGLVPMDEQTIARMLHRNPRHVRRLLLELTEAKKIRVTSDGMLTANRVNETRLEAQARSTSARHAINVRWENFRKTSEINGSAIRPVDLCNNFPEKPMKSTTQLYGSKQMPLVQCEFSRKANEINDPSILIREERKKEESKRERIRERGASGENSGNVDKSKPEEPFGERKESKETSLGSEQLRAVIRAKGWR